MVKKIILWALVIGLMVTIFAFSHQPSDMSQDLSDWLLNDILLFFKIEVDMPTLEFLSVAIRKLAHFSIYALLGFLLYLLMGVGYSIKPCKSVNRALVTSLFYAITDEVHQLFVPGRSGMAKDVFIDFAGATVGVMVAWCITLLFSRRSKNG